MKFAISIAFLLAASVGIGCASAADPIQLLETNDIRELDAELSGIQARFEAGSLSETELRAVFARGVRLRVDDARDRDATAQIGRAHV